MKKLVRAVSGGLALGLLGVSLASAQDATTNLPGTGWWTSAGIQNVGAGTTEVVLTAYTLSGSTSTTTNSKTFNLDKDKSVTFLPGAGNGTTGIVDLEPALGSGFVGSMVISSLEPLVAIAQVGNNQLTAYGVGVAGGYASEQYRGSSEGSTTLGYPLVKNNFAGKTTTFFVQSTGATATYTATIKTNDGTSHTKTGSIEANKTVVIDPDAGFTPALSNSSCGTSPNTSACVGSISIAASTPVVGTVLEHQTTTNGPATAVQATSMFAADAGDTTVNCPVFKNAYFGRTTGLTVLNLSDQPQDITAKLTLSQVGSTATSQEFTGTATGVAGGSSVTFDARVGNVGGFTSNGYGTVELSSAGKMIAIVNESGAATINGVTTTKQTTYSCFNTSATSKVALPQVKKLFAGSTTGVSVQNVGTTAVNVAAAFSCTNGKTYNPAPAEASGLAVGKGFTYFNPTGVDSNTNCAVTLTATAAGGSGTPKIVAIAQESSPSGLLNTKNYEGFNLQ